MARRTRSQARQIERELRHPLRRRIVRAVEDGEARTASELAELLGQTPARIHYHLRVLRIAGESRDRQAT
jgi:DNA-binding transcriptional ArsR family regulator